MEIGRAEKDSLIDISHAERNYEMSGSMLQRFGRFSYGNHNAILRANLTEDLDALQQFVTVIQLGNESFVP